MPGTLAVGVAAGSPLAVEPGVGGIRVGVGGSLRLGRLLAQLLQVGAAAASISARSAAGLIFAASAITPPCAGDSDPSSRLALVVGRLRGAWEVSISVFAAPSVVPEVAAANSAERS